MQIVKTLKALSFALALGCMLSIGWAQSPTDASPASRIEVKLPSATVRAEFCTGQIAHIVASGTIDNYHSNFPGTVHPCADLHTTRAETPDELILSSAQLRVAISKKTGAVRFLTPDNHLILAQEAADPRFGELQKSFRLSPGEAIYGLGQHQEGVLNLRDIPIRLLQANTNIAIPFLVSTRGYGLLWNSAALTDFNPADQQIPLDANGAGSFTTAEEGDYGFLLQGNLRNKLLLSVDGKPVIDLRNMWLPAAAGGKIHLAAHTAYRITAETGGDTKLAVRFPTPAMSFRAEVGQGSDYYFFAGPDPESALAEYRELTGVAPLLPRWAYGYWQCRERYASQKQILDTAEEFRKRQIPVDAMVQDWQYWGKYGWNAMRFDEDSYPDPAAMMSQLHQQKIHLLLSVWAKFGAETEMHQAFEKSGLLLHSHAATGEPGETNERESWIDFFHPAAQQAYWQALNQRLFALGIDGWWLDASEPEGDPLKNDVTHLGPGKFVRNAYPLFETSAVFNGQKQQDPEKRVVILSRSAFIGQQRNASISWSGDISATWETLRRQIPAGLNFSASGMPWWTTDVGGFFRPRDQYTSPEYQELLVRWFEFGAFSPIFRIHGYQSETEIWKYGAETERILRQYDELRYRLLPYIYSTAWEVSSRNASMMRALPLAYPHDPALRESTDAFLFGKAMLIAPVVEKGATSRAVVLPAGDNWVDFWSGNTFQGGETLRAQAPLDRLPIYVKAGSILPVGPVVQSADGVEDPLELRIYAGKDADFTLYEDSGDGYAYEHGERSIIPMHWDNQRRELTIAARSGSFAQMRLRHTFNLVLVSPEHGSGGDSTSVPDHQAVYNGQSVKIQLGNRR
jgi:alpha-D-xyloside xylohydrolase